MMFKRVLLLAVLVTALVVPGAAESQAIYFRGDSWDGWHSVSPYVTTENGYYTRLATGGGSNEGAYYTLPEGSLDGDFSLTIEGSGVKTAGSRGDCYIALYDGESRVVSASWAFSNKNYRRTYYKGVYSEQSSLGTSYSESASIVQSGDTLTVTVGPYSNTYPAHEWVDTPLLRYFGYKPSQYKYSDMRINSMVFRYNIGEYSGGGEPCTINVYDADSRLPLSGSWDYYIVVRGADSVSGSASGASAVVDLPVTSILQPHLLRVTKEGYEQTSPLAFDVPAGGREVNVYLTPLDTTAPEGSSVVTFIVTDIETGTPRGSCLVNVDGVGKYAGASGSVWFVLPENSTHQWLVTAEGYWPIGGDFTLGVDDLVIPVGMTKKTSELPRPPMPGIPGLPVIHPSLDPAGFRMQILNVPIIGGLAAPLLDTMDALAFGLNDIVEPVLDFATAPADSLVEVLSGVGDQLTESVATYTDIVGVLLGSVGKLLAVFPAMVVGLVTYNLVLDLVYLLLRGGL